MTVLVRIPVASTFDCDGIYIDKNMDKYRNELHRVYRSMRKGKKRLFETACRLYFSINLHMPRQTKAVTLNSSFFSR